MVCGGGWVVRAGVGGGWMGAVGTGVCVWACELGREMRRENTLTNSIVSWRLYITVQPGWYICKLHNAFTIQRED